MDIYEHLAEMKPFIQKQDWKGLETKYSTLCNALSGGAESKRISAISLTAYLVSLRKALTKSVSEAHKHKAKAIYFEYDLDNTWDSNFFICPAYNPEPQGDEDWACDWVSEVPGPSHQPMSEIYLENHFDKTDKAKGNTLYLVARTVSVLGQAMEGIGCDGLVVCAAFHDQDPIMRLNANEA
jgi:hypothetical protein